MNHGFECTIAQALFLYARVSASIHFHEGLSNIREEGVRAKSVRPKSIREARLIGQSAGRSPQTQGHFRLCHTRQQAMFIPTFGINMLKQCQP